MTTSNVMKYHISLRIMHWLMALLIFGMIATGWYMADLPKDLPIKTILVNLHKSFGATALILIFVRVLIRLTTNIPALPATLRAIESVAARLGHGLLYILMVIVPLSGYAMSNLYGYKVTLFGIDLPNLFPANKELAKLAREAHEILPYILLATIVLHVLAVIKHRYFDKKENNVLERML